MTKPVTSTSVATNGADALAGSKPIRCRMNGSIDPVSEPKVTMPISAVADGRSDQHPVFAVVIEAELLPDSDTHDPYHSQHRAECNSSRQLSQRHAPPLAKIQLSQRQRADQK